MSKFFNSISERERLKIFSSSYELSSKFKIALFVVMSFRTIYSILFVCLGVLFSLSVLEQGDFLLTQGAPIEVFIQNFMFLSFFGAFNLYFIWFRNNFLESLEMSIFIEVVFLIVIWFLFIFALEALFFPFLAVIHYFLVKNA